MKKLLPTVEKSSRSVLYAINETGLRTESDIRRMWSPVGASPCLESNNSHKGLNLIVATEFTKSFNSIIDAHSAEYGIKSEEIIHFLKRLLDTNKNKNVYVLLDNAKFHVSNLIQKFANKHKCRLFLINTTRYSHQLNPHENIWNKSKNSIFSTSAHSSIDDLFESVFFIYNHFN